MFALGWSESKLEGFLAGDRIHSLLKDRSRTFAGFSTVGKWVFRLENVRSGALVQKIGSIEAAEAGFSKPRDGQIGVGCGL